MNNKEMYELHELYNKHEITEAGRAKWGEEWDPVYSCTCGAYYYDAVDEHGDELKRTYGYHTAHDWLIATAEGLKPKQLAAFRAFLHTVNNLRLPPNVYRAVFGTRKPGPKAAVTKEATHETQ